MLETYTVSLREGRVCYVTPGATKTGITVECSIANVAFKFDVEKTRHVNVGDYVEFSGVVRMDPRLVKKTGEPVEKNLTYYHEPFCGSDRRHWVFFELRVKSWKRIAPPDVAEVLREVLQTTRTLLAEWEDVSADSLHESIRAHEQASAHMREILKQKRLEESDARATVSVIEIAV